jgi:hypothetical protein
VSIHLPAFTRAGLLPEGEYALTFNELQSSKLVLGPESERDQPGSWDVAWRKHLTHQAETVCNQLWAIGIADIFLNGSFVEDKAHPNDIDRYFECDVHRFASGEIQRELNAIDPKKCWTWDPAERRAYRGYAKKQLPMWHAYRVEMYPHYGQFSGITDDHGHPLTFPSAFRKRRADNMPKGIIRVIRNRE